MFSRKKSGDTGKTSASAGGSSAAALPSSAPPKLTIHEKSSGEKVMRRTFPGPRQADVLLRVALERSAYAELIAHAKESLEVEVCGVLVGHVCEDDAGRFVHVEAIIRGTAASQASTHVTFTQETWNLIHQSLERDYPKLRMVGWYHTHPGFGVEFSDMDLFIQKNFFSGPAQIALVTDPLSGAVAICVNTPSGVQYLPRFWVDGREQLSRIPKSESSPSAAAAEGPEAADEMAKNVKALEARVSQLVQVIDEQRASYYRFLMFVGVTICLALVAAVGYTIRSQFISRNEPPRLNSYVPVPIQVGDKVVMVGLGVAEWEVPPELNALQLQLEKMKQEAAAAEAAKTNAPAGTNATPPDATAPKARKTPKTK